MNEFRLTMYKIKENTTLVSNTITNLLMQLIFLNWIIILRQMGTFSMIHFNVKVLVILLTRTLYEYIRVFQRFGGVNVYECDLSLDINLPHLLNSIVYFKILCYTHF